MSPKEFSTQILELQRWCYITVDASETWRRMLRMLIWKKSPTTCRALYTSQVVQDFFHQRYHEEARYLKFGDLSKGKTS